MIRSFKERRENEEGFTLIELMVVVLIIGILLAIAVPTFLNAQNNAKTKAATSNLRSALSSVKTVYADKQTYAADTTATAAKPIDQAALKKAEPSIGWVATENELSAGPEAVSWQGESTLMQMAVLSKLGDCFLIADNVADTNGGTTYGKIAKASVPDPAGCQASLATGAVMKTSPSLADW